MPGRAEDHALRGRIERFFNQIKNAPCVVTRYHKLAATFLGFVQIATIRAWSGLSTRESHL